MGERNSSLVLHAMAKQARLGVIAEVGQTWTCATSAEQHFYAVLGALGMGEVVKMILLQIEIYCYLPNHYPPVRVLAICLRQNCSTHSL